MLLVCLRCFLNLSVGSTLHLSVLTLCGNSLTFTHTSPSSNTAVPGAILPNNSHSLPPCWRSSASYPAPNVGLSKICLSFFNCLPWDCKLSRSESYKEMNPDCQEGLGDPHSISGHGGSLSMAGLLFLEKCPVPSWSIGPSHSSAQASCWSLHWLTPVQL